MLHRQQKEALQPNRDMNARQPRRDFYTAEMKNHRPLNTLEVEEIHQAEEGAKNRQSWNKFFVIFLSQQRFRHRNRTI